MILKVKHALSDLRARRPQLAGKPSGGTPGTPARLQALRDAGRPVVAGPNPAIDSNDPGAAGFTGSTVIAEFESLAEARARAQQDPYIAAGVYADVTVKPFKQVF